MRKRVTDCICVCVSGTMDVILSSPFVFTEQHCMESTTLDREIYTYYALCNTTCVFLHAQKVPHPLSAKKKHYGDEKRA